MKNNYLKNRYVVEHYAGKEVSSDGLDAVEKYSKIFSVSKNTNHKTYLPRNEQRYSLVADNFKKYFGDKILDVGSRSNLLSEKIGKRCELVDKNNKDLKRFDWENEKLPFDGNSFDTVVCLDTLEHIDNLHDGFYDLLRVSSKHVIISLPNPWKRALGEFVRGRGKWQNYGISPEKQIDRHKWFFNTEDAEMFFFYNSASSKGNYTVREVVYHSPKIILRNKIIYPLVKAFLPKRYFKNFFVETVFFVLEKK